MRADLDELQKERDAAIEELGEAMKSPPPGDDITKELQRMTDELQRKQEEIDTLLAQNSDLKSQVDDLGIELRKLIDENRELNERVIALETSLRTQTGAFEENRTQLEKELEEIKRQNSDLNGRNQELTADIERVTTELSSKDTQVAAVTKECEELRRQLVEASAQIDSLERERDTDKKLLRECLEREAQGSGAGAGVVETQHPYALATREGTNSLYALATAEPPRAVYDTASRTDSKITRDVKQRICEHFKVFNKSKAPIDSFVIKKEGLFHFANKGDFNCDGSEVLGNKISKQDLMRYPEFLMIFDGSSGDLDFDMMRQVYSKDAKSKNANFDTRYSGIDLPVKLTRIKKENRFQIQPNESYFIEINKLKLYEHYKSKYGLDAGGTIERKKRTNSMKYGIGKGGSRTKKLNKINSRNKSKKINF
jgi:predicted  nucleic acid-binding Zn-ribbon protein